MEEHVSDELPYPCPPEDIGGNEAEYLKIRSGQKLLNDEKAHVEEEYCAHGFAKRRYSGMDGSSIILHDRLLFCLTLLEGTWEVKEQQPVSSGLERAKAFIYDASGGRV